MKESAVVHEIQPVYDKHSKILILGSFPSVKSRESGFFYGHPQNRFWRVLASLHGTATPSDTEEKKKLLCDMGVALWDVIASCEITGSADSTITKVVPNDLSAVLDKVPIERIFVNGKTAERYYNRYLGKRVGREAACLPSTSPANAAWSLERLVGAWGVILGVT